MPPCWQWPLAWPDIQGQWLSARFILNILALSFKNKGVHGTKAGIECFPWPVKNALQYHIIKPKMLRDKQPNNKIKTLYCSGQFSEALSSCPLSNSSWPPGDLQRKMITSKTCRRTPCRSPRHAGCPMAVWCPRMTLDRRRRLYSVCQKEQVRKKQNNQ